MKKWTLALLVLGLVVALLGSTSPPVFSDSSTPTPAPAALTFPKIDRHPGPVQMLNLLGEEFPRYSPSLAGRPWQVDLRMANASDFDLRDALTDLLHATFDSRTLWPPADRLPPEFDPQVIMETGKNPGLGVRRLHEQGITGRGVGIAIVDQPLLTDHQEYVNQLRLYEELDDITGEWLVGSMHGPAVASIAVGQTVGVAPDADLYFIATAMGGGDEPDFSYLARGIRRVLEINAQLPADRKIRVISASIGWDNSSVTGYDEVIAAIDDAKAAGLFVICTSEEELYGFKFNGLGRVPTTDPDDVTSYLPGEFWAQYFYPQFDQSYWQGQLMVPMDSRTTASPSGLDEYVFYATGGWSWAVPYLAGTYALAAQVDPAITPERFWSLGLETGQTIDLEHEGSTIPFGTILDPAALIAALQS
jgi:hypothetical protein